jgi:diguanylate cyclase (GGDEF)-like protein
MPVASVTVLRCYAVASFGVTAAYLAFPADLRVGPFLAVTLGAIPAVVAGVRRCPGAARLPWWLLLVALLFFNVGNVVWIWYAFVEHRVTGDGTSADLFFAVANLLLLGAALVVVVRRSRRDVGGVIDAAITALALGGLLWSTVLLPHLAENGASTTRQIGLFVDVFVMMGTLGALLRVSLVSPERIWAMRLLTLALACALVANLAVTLFTDPITLVRPDWTNLPFLVSYSLLGCAALHPSAALLTRAGAAPDDDLSAARLTFLGLMLALVPLLGGGRVLLGLPTDGVLLVFGSASVIPLVMVRIARLSAQRRQAERALRRMATYDSLTALPNRATCLDRITADLAQLPPDDNRPGLAVFFCDLDGFKPVNDRLGHAAGDALLVAVADRLRACARDSDLVSRFGGDEFVIVCRSGDPQTAVQLMCERIRAGVLSPITVGEESVQVGLSVGVAFAGSGCTADDVISRADFAMYAAKQTKCIGALSLAIA